MSESRFQVRELKREWLASRFVVVDTHSGKRVSDKDSEKTAAELAAILNDCWSEILTATKE